MGGYPFSTELEAGREGAGWTVLLVGLRHRVHARFGMWPGAVLRRRAHQATRGHSTALPRLKAFRRPAQGACADVAPKV
jgi:hypothetical protein